MKHIHPVGSNEHTPVEPCCLGVDICNFYDIAECPVADWCYVFCQQIGAIQLTSSFCV
jgi:hypothetical protein